MTPNEQKAWSELNVLGETEAGIAQILAFIRAGESREEVFMAGLCAYAKAHQSLRAQLLDAEERRPRVYVLECPPNVCLASGFPPTSKSKGN